VVPPEVGQKASSAFRTVPHLMVRTDGARRLREPGFGVAPGLINMQRTPRNFVGLFAVLSPLAPTTCEVADETPGMLLHRCIGSTENDAS
jgi:hypothetical protein